MQQKQRHDQLCSYCRADLRLCFRPCKLLVFSCGGSIFCFPMILHIIHQNCSAQDEKYISRVMRKLTMSFLNRSDTNRAVQAQKMARGWNLWILKVEKLYYPCSENKGADHLCNYCEADLHLCFRISEIMVFS